MKKLFIHFATKSDLDINEVSIDEYTDHKSTECVLCTILVNGEFYSLCPISDKEKIIELTRQSRLVCFSLSFSINIVVDILLKKYNYFLLTAKILGVTNGFFLPNKKCSLKKLCCILSIPFIDDVNGYNAKLAIARSEKPVDFESETFKDLIKYSIRHVTLLEKILCRLEAMSLEEIDAAKDLIE